MRIVAGRFKGHRLTALGAGDRAAQLRPTADRVRESLFSALAAWPGGPLEDARVLDLFAGTGALGLEALSRGAASALFVENGRRALAVLRANIDRLGCADTARVAARDATRLGAADAPPAGLVFLDPPYGRGLGDRALGAASAGGWIAPGALVIWEEAGAQPAPPGFAPRAERRYGDTTITILEAAP